MKTIKRQPIVELNSELKQLEKTFTDILESIHKMIDTFDKLLEPISVAEELGDGYRDVK